jgi:molybdenum cofactor synthesis domain-containing protein
MKATVLGIGTELVDGQIVNKNAAWISKQLKDLGLTSTLHLVVPDERKLILEALDFCSKHGDLIFVTGGLGPTSDDFTRDLISEWTKLPLEFDEASWQQIKERLEPRGYAVKEIQRQQCFFPRNSQILKNPEGTANGFFVEANDKKLFILPGPPREIDAIWKSSISNWLQLNTGHIDPMITKHWDTIGVGESDIALIVEDIVKGSGLEKGYRVHLPYVEVKLSYLKSQEALFAPLLNKVTEALSHCLVTQNQEDVAKMFTQKLQNYDSISIQDSVTGAYLMNRLLPVSRDLFNKPAWSFSNITIDEKSQIKLFLDKQDEQTCMVRIEKEGQSFSDVLETPYKSTLMKDRRLQYFAELAMIFWLKHL